MNNDPRFGLVALAEIAMRALSPARTGHCDRRHWYSGTFVRALEGSSREAKAMTSEEDLQAIREAAQFSAGTA